MTMSHDPFDLSRLHVDGETVARKVKRPKSWRHYYVRVPWTWVEQLRSTKRVSTYRVALVLLYEHWRRGGKPVALSNVITQQEGVASRSKWRALDELAKLGLITVETKPGRSPQIVVLKTAAD
ncbi:hypothetical protein G5V57_07420 [Nordella sp. HKS 07]|uniref:hypothetical protein n=1 Tax=Nordella sp. HKS 07 TaxID=2712222 RepID=UPI0013E1E29E|nr:hypothetical protein [Nordella sp. HKS 07]QIG47572.1 hypothetical protein G5V57_07420 [Nordella sp. HKS 07]